MSTKVASMCDALGWEYASALGGTCFHGHVRVTGLGGFCYVAVRDLEALSSMPLGDIPLYLASGELAGQLANTANGGIGPMDEFLYRTVCVPYLSLRLELEL